MIPSIVPTLHGTFLVTHLDERGVPLYPAVEVAPGDMGVDAIAAELLAGFLSSGQPELIYSETRESVAVSCIVELAAWCEREHTSLKSMSPPAEVESWSVQQREAEAAAANSDAKAPYLYALSASRGIPFEEMVVRVLSKSTAYLTASAALVGRYQRAKDVIHAYLADEQLSDEQAIAAMRALEP